METLGDKQNRPTCPDSEGKLQANIPEEYRSKNIYGP